MGRSYLIAAVALAALDWLRTFSPVASEGGDHHDVWSIEPRTRAHSCFAFSRSLSM